MRVFAVILTVLALLCAPVPARGDIYLRVIADSDAEEAQALKLRVRDAALAVCQDDAAPSPALLAGIKCAVNAVAPCEVALVLWRPDQEHPPAPTVRVTLGSGEGRNWWGVLYEESIDFFAEDGAENNRDIGRGDTVHFRWALWEAVRRLFGF